jgi:hypothetical protein
MSAVQPACGVSWGLGFGCALGFFIPYVLYHCQICFLSAFMSWRDISRFEVSCVVLS